MKNIIAIILLTTFMAATAHARSLFVKTQTGNSIGLSLSSYKYEEPQIMSATGIKMGLDMRVTQVFQREQFIRGELRYAFGTVDYNGSGNLNGEPDWYIEARGLAGKDWVINKGVLSPYTGVGYRYLFNDGRGITSTNYWGYRRASNYLYWPVGFTHRLKFKEGMLVSMLEYDHLLRGKQISRLSDGGQGDGDITNIQSRGYGLKFSMSYQEKNWAAGPFFNYWNIAQSDMQPEIRNGTPTGWWALEPKNNTVEFGLRISQQF